MAEQVFYEIARWRLDEQLAQNRELNARLVTVLSGATALLALFAALQDFQAWSGDDVVIGLASGAVGVYVALLVTSLLGYRESNMQLGLSPKALDDTAMGDSSGQIIAARALTYSLDANERLLIRKSRLVFAAVSLWAIDGLLLLAIALSAAS